MPHNRIVFIAYDCNVDWVAKQFSPFTHVLRWIFWRVPVVAYQNLEKRLLCSADTGPASFGTLGAGAVCKGQVTMHDLKVSNRELPLISEKKGSFLVAEDSLVDHPQSTRMLWFRSGTTPQTVNHLRNRQGKIL